MRSLHTLEIEVLPFPPTSMMLVEKVKKALINGEKVGVVFFDFKDAFGSVNRTRLLEKLGVDFGISGKLFLHIKSFLGDRYSMLKMAGLF